MKFSTNIILGVVAFALLCLVYYSDNYFSQKKQERKEELSKALFFKTQDVLKFSLKNPNGNFAFIRENKTSDWKMTAPQQIEADQDAVLSTLSSLGQIMVQQELPGLEKINKSALSPFGLDNPKIVATLTLVDKKTETLEIGNNVEIGSKMSGKINPVSVYGLNLNRAHILVMDSSSPGLLENKNFSDFRTKKPTVFKEKDVAAIYISSKNMNLAMEKKQNKWQVVTSKNAPGDDAFISSFIQTYQSMVVQKVIEKNEALKTGLGKYDLSTPAAKIKFADASGKVLQEFKFGITKEAVYIQMPDGAVGKLSLSSWPDYVPLAVKFRKADKT